MFYDDNGEWLPSRAAVENMKNEIAEKLSALAEAADSASCDVENFGGDEALDLLSLAKDIYELVA